MNHFDLSAPQWDENPIHFERSKAIATQLFSILNFKDKPTSIEFGAGTGILSLMLKDFLATCTLIDSSKEMLSVAKQKIDTVAASHFSCRTMDLETENWSDEPVDLLFSQMALHHVKEIPAIFNKFSQMILPGGYLAIADLYPEDGSFHGEGHEVHLGFDTEELSKLLLLNNLQVVYCEQVFSIRKNVNNEFKEFPIFLLLARK